MIETRFAALKELRHTLPSAAPTAPKPPKAPPAPVRTTAKSSNQEFERLTVYVRKESKKAGTRKWEDATGGDMSDLIEHLLSKYLST